MADNCYEYVDENLRAIRENIAETAEKCGRNADSVSLMTVTKTFAPEIELGIKITNHYRWWMAAVVDNSRKEYAVGNYVQIKFDSSDENFDAVITAVNDDGDLERSMLIVECTHFNVQHPVKYARLIKGEYSGLKVPRDFIRFDDIEENVYDEKGEIKGSAVTNYKGVHILKGEQIVFKKIDVIYEGSDYVLSKVHDDDSSYLALYDDIITEGEENGR